MLVDGGLIVRSSTVTERSMYMLSLARVGPSRGSHLEREHVETADEHVDGLDDAPLLDKDVVDLDGADPRAARWRGDVERDLFRPERIGQVERPDAAVEKAAEDHRLGHPRARRGAVLVQVVGAV